MSALLLAAIAAETAALEDFISVLQEEQRLLISGDADAVLSLLDKKSALINELGVAGQQREDALSTLGVQTSKEAIQTWLAAGASDELQTRWKQLLELAQTANRINGTNGQLINTRLQHNQQALSILMNAGGSQLENDTYGPDGHKKHGPGSRTLGSA